MCIPPPSSSTSFMWRLGVFLVAYLVSFKVSRRFIFIFGCSCIDTVSTINYEDETLLGRVLTYLPRSFLPSLLAAHRRSCKLSKLGQ